MCTLFQVYELCPVLEGSTEHQGQLLPYLRCLLSSIPLSHSVLSQSRLVTMSRGPCLASSTLSVSWRTLTVCGVRVRVRVI